MFNLLLAAESGSSSAQASSGMPGWIIWVFFGVIIVVMFGFSYLRSKKEKKNYDEKMSKMSVGATVKTIGLIIGEIVAMDDLTVTIKTGTEENFSYVTVEKRAVYEILSEGLSQSEDGVFEDDAELTAGGDEPTAEDLATTDNTDDVDNTETTDNIDDVPTTDAE